LSNKILHKEHELYVDSVKLFSEGLLLRRKRWVSSSQDF
jgi:hypothetical protein